MKIKNDTVENALCGWLEHILMWGLVNGLADELVGIYSYQFITTLQFNHFEAII